jgi:PKD repeat protein
MHVSSRVGRRSISAALTLVLVGSWIAITNSHAARADTAPPDPTTPVTVSADSLPTVQIDGVVWSQAIVGTTVYAGGSFANARPAGAAAGTNLTPRDNFLSYDLTTGALNTAFVPDLNAQAKAVVASPDGSTVYVGGDFTTANGVNRYRLAAYSTSTGALITTFAPNLNAGVSAIVATNTTVYVGGAFTTANGVARSKLAAFSATDGSLLSWAPSANDGIAAMVMAPDQSKVIVGGQFTTLNGTAEYGMGALDPTTGANLPWAADSVVKDAGINAAIDTLTTDGTNIYGGGYVFGSGGNLEGVFAADPSTGAIKWIEDCHGDTYSTYSDGNALYEVGHQHYCDDVPGAFSQTNPWTIHHSQAFSTAVEGTLLHNTQSAYADFGGTPAPEQLDWYPTFVDGTYTGQTQAAWNITGNGQYVVEGGEFPTVNGVGQQGLARFAVRAIAPNKMGPQVTGNKFVPTITSITGGTARVAFQANWDQDNTQLTYKVVRDSNTAHPVFTTTVNSTFFNRPMLGFTDTGLVVGQSYKYRLYVTDPLGNQVAGDTVTFTPTANTVSPYAQAIINDAPNTYWRLGEASGPTAYDWAGYSDGLVGAGVTRGAAGAISGDSNTASTFNGTATSIVSHPLSQVAPTSFSLEGWFKTTSTTGGRIIGFGDTQTGTSGKGADRTVYMTTGGQLDFGVISGSTEDAGAKTTIASTGSFNDGQWHYFVASLGSGGMSLYVDSKRVAQNGAITSAVAYQGWWRLGGDTLSGFANKPSNVNFNGSLDDVAIYSAPLTTAQIANHFNASGRTAAGSRPTDTYGSTIYDASPSLYWRLDESSGTVAHDVTPNGNNGTYSGGVTFGTPGAITGTTDTAVTMNGSNGVVSTTTAVPGPSVYSEELWFKTTTTTGGKLIGFGSSATGSSSSYDRHVYMLNNGELTFGAYTGVSNVITSTSSYNDGKWHQMVATEASDGMKLYVDGALVASGAATGSQSYNGFWRVGGDNLASWPNQPTSNYFAGSIDEAAVYTTELSAAQVSDHFAKGNGAANIPPTAAFSSSANNLVASFDGSGSTDIDGTIASYAWTFGDGSTGTGVKPSHTYSTANTYNVTLTVTDNSGATNAITHQITVAAANILPTASFTATSKNFTATFNASASKDTDGTIASYAWNFGDNTTGTGVNPSHTYAAGNTYLVTLTVTDNSGGTGTMQQSVTVSNAPPSAAFTSAAAGLVATFNGGGSVDSDGSIASYAWTFGDGSTGSGATPTHTYASGATYSVTLTVTDNQGATGSVTNPITVAQGAVTPYGTDSFGRTLASGWGSADTGGPWTVSKASNFSVGSGVGVIAMPTAGSSSNVFLPSVAATDTEVRVGVALNEAQTGGGTYISVVGRRTSATTDYRVKLKVASTGVVTEVLEQVTGSVETVLKSVTVPGVTYTPGMVLNVRLQVTGTSPTTLNSMVWANGTTQPTAWQETATDSTAGLQVAGAVALIPYLSGSATNAPENASFSTFWAGPTHASGTNTPPTAAFSSSSSNLIASFNAGASSDSDGTIASYAWNFGDGSTGTGVTPTHTYATGNTYSVMLTVTDNQGATGTVTNPITVAAQGAITPFATDSFGRTVAGGWGTADSGGAWTISGGAANFSVGGGTGNINLATAGMSASSALTSVTSTDTEVRVGVALNEAQTGGGTYISVIGRRISSTSDYRVKLKVASTGVVTEVLESVVGGTETALKSVTVPGVTYTPGMVLNVRLQVTGTSPTTLNSMVWANGTTQPTTWQATTTDSTSILQVAGAVGLLVYLSGSATNAPETASFNNYWAGPTH